MAIIPNNWTGQETVNTNINSNGNPCYQYAQTVITTINTLNEYIDLIGTCSEVINREVSMDIISGRTKLYWKNLDGSYQLINPTDINWKDSFIDLSLGQLGLSMITTESTEIFFNVRWDRNIEFPIYNDVIINPPDNNLIVVIDNAFYIDENIAASGNNDLINCTAYFSDGFTQPSISWHLLYAVNCTGEFGIIRGEVGNPNYVYPSQGDPFTFSFYPQETIQGHFEIYRVSGELDFKETLRIVSFDNLTNTFVIDFP